MPLPITITWCIATDRETSTDGDILSNNDWMQSNWTWAVVA